MPDEMRNQRVIITVHARDLTDNQLAALRNGIKGLLQQHEGAGMQTRIIERTTAAPPEPPPEPTA